MTRTRRAGFPAQLDAPARPARASPAGGLLRPQRPLQQAALDARRGAAPGGIGLDSDAVRERLVQRLRAAEGGHDAVWAALRQVARHRFVDSALAIQAYEDTSLPIGLGQTISKPSVVARMLSLLHEGTNARRLGHLGRVLEVGTGCGYQTALLLRLAPRIVSIERLRPLFDKAAALLADERGQALRLVHGDGMLGHAPLAPYDSLIAAAGGDDLPPAWLAQLDVGGRLVAPLRGDDGRQSLVVVDRTAAGFERQVFEGVHFVPLKSGVL